MKTKILTSLLVILVAVSMIVGSTVAYFSDTGYAEGNTFTSGTLIMKMSNGGDYADGVNATWKSPLNWAPGETVTGKLEFTNIGNVDSHHIYYNFAESGDVNFMKKIIVTSLKERFDGVLTGEQVAICAAQTGNGDSVLTLYELVNQAWYTFDDKSGDGVVLKGGDVKDYSILFTFKFAEDAGNEYQGLECGFNLECIATQNSPTDGMVCFHEIQ